MGFPIRKSPGQRLFATSPKLIAGYHVLHRLLLPRHPPCTLSHLTIQLKNNLMPFVHSTSSDSYILNELASVIKPSELQQLKSVRCHEYTLE